MKYTGQHTYDLEICGLHRELPINQISDRRWLPSFVMLGDVELINKVTTAMTEKLKNYDFDLMVAPEAKVIPLIHNLATALGHERYTICRKFVRAYMQNPIVIEIEDSFSIRGGKRTFSMDGRDAQYIAGKKVALIDDCVYTGGVMKSLEQIVRKAGGIVTVKASVLKEEDWEDGDHVFLQELPVFTR